MKKHLFLILFSILIMSAFAQNDVVKTKIEEAISTRDFLYKQEIFLLDNLPSFRIDAVKITNLENFSVVSGLKTVQKIQVGKELKSFYNYIDVDEIDGIITSLQYMATILKSKTIPGSYTEIKFTSKSGFQVMLQTFLNDSNKLDWRFIGQTNIANDKTFATFQNDDVSRLQKIFEQAKSKL